MPEGFTEDSYLRDLCEQGIVRRYGAEPGQEVIERLDFELGVIGEMGFAAYFLIVWDYVKFAKDNGIAVGPGRGSAAGSPSSPTALGITDIDPLKYDLLFERFLNPERKSMPDIDIDFSVTSGARKSSSTSRRSTAGTGWRRSSPSAPWPRARPYATPRASWACRTPSATASPR